MDSNYRDPLTTWKICTFSFRAKISPHYCNVPSKNNIENLIDFHLMVKTLNHLIINFTSPRNTLLFLRTCVYIHTYATYVHTPCLYVSFSDSIVCFVSDNGPLFLLLFLDFFFLHLAPSTMILYFKNHSHPFVTKRNTIQNDLSTIQHITRAYTQRTRPIDQPTARFGLETCALFFSRINRKLSPIFVNTLRYSVNTKKNKGWTRKFFIMYQTRETKARLKKVKNDKKKETKAKGSRLFSLLLRPEGGWSAGWDRTRWLVARQPDFLSLSHAHATSLPSHSFSLCPFLFFYPSVPFSVTQFRTGASLAFALRAHSFFHLFIGYHCSLSPSFSHWRVAAAAAAAHTYTPVPLALSLFLSRSVDSPPPAYSGNAQKILSYIYLGRWL